MLERRGRGLVKWPSAGCFTLAMILLSLDHASAGTLIKLSWSANSEADLAGYRLQYGTAAGTYTQTIDVGKITSYQIQNLDATKTWYFVLRAFDYSGNVSQPSAEVSGKPQVIAGSAPTVASALELSSNSIYIMQSGRHDIQVTGTNFQSGAAIDLGGDITEGATSPSGTTKLTDTINVAPTAALGPRLLTVLNPDGGSGTRSAALTVVKTTDVNRDCLIDGADLNSLARAWNTTSVDPGFIDRADLNGDSRVDGDDLLIFTSYFGRRLAVCP